MLAWRYSVYNASETLHVLNTADIQLFIVRHVVFALDMSIHTFLLLLLLRVQTYTFKYPRLGVASYNIYLPTSLLSTGQSNLSERGSG